MKYGRADVVKSAGLETELEIEEPDEGDEVADEPRADELVADLEKMGPTFIKLSQLLSSRGEILPPAYLSAVERLQDDVEAFPYEQVEATVPKSWGADLQGILLL